VKTQKPTIIILYIVITDERKLKNVVLRWPPMA
jgi:hypothetical protein